MPGIQNVDSEDLSVEEFRCQVPRGVLDPLVCFFLTHLLPWPHPLLQGPLEAHHHLHGPLLVFWNTFHCMGFSLTIRSISLVC